VDGEADGGEPFGMLPTILLGHTPETVRTMGGRKIAGQYESSRGQKQQVFGRVDPFCLFAVLPLLVLAGLFIWGGIAIIGVVLVVLAVLIVVFDSWTNRPVKKSSPGYRDNR
jgi:hypothetical protein